ncbi:MAG: peptide chain release factor 3 [Anaerolineales bacterium]|nr:peptide chain release factor 3 [Anaerolineales bacterium]MBP6208762.1 peptide chain release factor 3 [Anaerolineales bacterium]
MEETTAQDQPSSSLSLEEATAIRRTFAIISHPDAGKTTLTEKLLLYGNAIDLAGNVRAKRNQRSATSDWMAMERERGISITSTILQFPYKGHVINLLDTPGHQDFSEDTYRTLSAVDSAVMVLDAAKGIEPQTRKLFDVCRKRGIPIFTFINKMDRPARSPLELLDEIESILGMEPVPMNWPIGDGPQFRGVYDRYSKGVYLYERTERNEKEALEEFIPLDEIHHHDHLSEKEQKLIEEDIQLLDGLGITFDLKRLLRMEQTPVFFGSALTNFGVRLFLNAFVKFAPPPQPYQSEDEFIEPTRPDFSGYVFKIQANMNPKHRDSVAFLRVCSGRFERGLATTHAQSGSTVRLMRPYKLFANEREIVDEAYPGDVVGIPNNGTLGIGDTLYTGSPVRFAAMPHFQPEHFALLKNTDLSKQKQFMKGLEQLESEGSMQVFFNTNAFKREPIIAVVGQLQFDVVQARLEMEYNVSTVLERLPHILARWVEGTEDAFKNLPSRAEVLLARDSSDNKVALFSSTFHLNYYAEKHPEVKFKEMG